MCLPLIKKAQINKINTIRKPHKGYIPLGYYVIWHAETGDFAL